MKEKKILFFSLSLSDQILSFFLFSSVYSGTFKDMQKNDWFTDTFKVDICGHSNMIERK